MQFCYCPLYLLLRHIRCFLLYNLKYLSYVKLLFTNKTSLPHIMVKKLQQEKNRLCSKIKTFFFPFVTLTSVIVLATSKSNI
jgi:hypothetical protein